MLDNALRCPIDVHHARRYCPVMRADVSEAHHVETYAQQNPRIAEQGHRSTLRKRCRVETLAGLLTLDLRLLQKYLDPTTRQR